LMRDFFALQINVHHNKNYSGMELARIVPNSKKL